MEPPIRSIHFSTALRALHYIKANTESPCSTIAPSQAQRQFLATTTAAAPLVTHSASCHRSRSSSRKPLPCHLNSYMRFYHANNINNNKKRIILDESSLTDFSALDVLRHAPIPVTSIEHCLSDGFRLNSGIAISDGDGALLVGGEAFAWRPWEEGSQNKDNDNKTKKQKKKFKLLNERGQWDVAPEALGLLSLVWPRPDLLLVGTGSRIRPLSERTRRALMEWGVRVEVLGTREAAGQYNLLATERGVDDVAAALVPVGWEEKEEEES